MNAAETIQAAIEKLGREAAAPAGEDRVGATSREALTLVATLHRTIDAQLAILRIGLRTAEGIGVWDSPYGTVPYEQQSLDLARAILGEDN